MIDYFNLLTGVLVAMYGSFAMYNPLFVSSFLNVVSLKTKKIQGIAVIGFLWSAIGLYINPDLSFSKDSIFSILYILTGFKSLYYFIFPSTLSYFQPILTEKLIAIQGLINFILGVILVYILL